MPGRKALRTSGRSKATRTVPWSDRSVVCDVGEFADVVDRRPASRVEQWGDRLVGHGGEARPGRVARAFGYSGTRWSRASKRSNQVSIKATPRSSPNSNWSSPDIRCNNRRRASS